MDTTRQPLVIDGHPLRIKPVTDYTLRDMTAAPAGWVAEIGDATYPVVAWGRADWVTYPVAAAPHGPLDIPGDVRAQHSDKGQFRPVGVIANDGGLEVAEAYGRSVRYVFAGTVSK